MVKLVGAVRNYRVNIKHVQIDVEDGTGLVRIILVRKERECTACRTHGNNLYGQWRKI